jgi:3-oxoacyl-[acyl-carrier-protein] synthase II
VDPGARLGRKGLRYVDRASQLALCAAHDALHEAALLPLGDPETGSSTGEGPASAVDGASIAVVVSSNLGNLDTVCTVAAGIAEEGTDRISPMALPTASSNVIASAVATRFGLRGPNLMFCNGPTSGLDAVYWAASLIAAGRSTHSLVVGVETANSVVEQFVGVPGHDLLDGAVALLLERADTARARGVAPVAHLGPYIREGSVAECVNRLIGDGRPGPGLWLTGHPRGTGGEPARTTALPRHDLTTAHGHASGALGVLQCAAAIGWFGAGAEDAESARDGALLTNGDDRADGVAGMLLSPAKGER